MVRDRGDPKPALRFAYGLEFRPGRSVIKRLAGYVSALAFRHAACKFKRCPGKGNRARPQVERRGRLPLEDVQDIPCFQGRTDPAADPD